jgi:transposase
MTDRRRYTAEFKREAVQLSETSGKSIRQVAQELGLTTKLLYRWRSELLKGGTDAFPGHGTLPPSEQEVATLRRELERVRQERDILKKALSIFSQVQ